MGCFSFLCKECGEPILSNSFRGQKVKLFLLENGIIIQAMEGEYDSYGRVFTEDLKGSVHWKKEWNDVVDLMFMDDERNGIAAIHSKCWKDLLPVTRSEDDPNQGWGEDDELLSNSDKDLDFDN